MTAQAVAESAAAITAFLVLVVAILSVWALRDRAKHADDETAAGLAVFVKDPTPAPCPDCGGEGWVQIKVRGYYVEVPCDGCKAWDIAERAYERRQDV